MKYLILAEMAQASAEVARTTGMSIMDSGMVTALLTGVATIIGALGTLVGIMLWGKRSEKVKRPLDSEDLYVRQCECAQYRAAISKRIDELGPALNRIFQKLSDNDRKSEERSMKLNQRLDPFIEKTAANAEAINILKEMITEKKNA